MAESTIWWVLAGAMVAVELLTGTFYLLMLSLGMVGAAIAAHLGASTAAQLVVAAVVGGGSVVAWRGYKLRTAARLRVSADQAANLDIGATVHIDVWGPDGTSTVMYRGANWQVSLIAGATPSPGNYRIVELVGSRLLVRKL